jgi:hypothetical protein
VEGVDVFDGEKFAIESQVWWGAGGDVEVRGFVVHELFEQVVDAERFDLVCAGWRGHRCR